MKQYTVETKVGAFLMIGLVIGLLCVDYMAIRSGKVPFLGNNAYPLHTRFFKVTDPEPDSRMEMSDIKIQPVAGLTLDRKNVQATAKSRIDKGVEIHDASVKTEGMTDAGFVSIAPGGPAEPVKSRRTIGDTVPSPDIGNLMGEYVFGIVEKNRVRKGMPGV